MNNKELTDEQKNEAQEQFVKFVESSHLFRMGVSSADQQIYHAGYRAGLQSLTDIIIDNQSKP